MSVQTTPLETGRGAAPGVAVSAASAGSKRLASIEWLRIIAAFGIVFFHVHAFGWRVGYMGLPALTAISIAFTLAAPKDLRQIGKRAGRLLAPWIFWCVAYLALSIALTLHHHEPLSRAFAFTWRDLFVGTAIHLWFLPFLFLANLLVALLRVPVRPGLAWMYTAATVASLPIIAALFAMQHFAEPFAQWLFVAPALLWGAVLACQKHGGKTIRFDFIAQAIVVMAALVAVDAFINKELTVPHLVAVAATTAACCLPQKAGPVALWAGGLSFGVYLVHPMLTVPVYKVMGGGNSTLYAVALCLVSAVMIAALKLTPLKRFM